jgi:hypothetical protein
LPVVGAFAHIASGGGWQTTLGVYNPNDTAATVELNFYDDKGVALALPLPSPAAGVVQAVTSLTLQVAPHGIAYTQTAGTLTQTGWALVQSNQSNLGGLAFYNLNGAVLGGSEQQGISMLEARTATGYGIAWIQGHDQATAIALANRTAQPLTVTATVRAPDGTVMGQVSLELAPYGHRAFVLGQDVITFSTPLEVTSIEFSTKTPGALAVMGLTINQATGSFGVSPSMPMVTAN